MSLVLGVLLAVAVGYQLAAWLLTERFVRQELRAPTTTDSPPPGVSQLKPICGVSPQTQPCLQSFLDQDYDGPHEVIFTAEREGDPAAELARGLSGPAQVVEGARRSASNRKVAGLVEGYPHCRYELVVVSDADMRVRPDYLSRLAGVFTDRSVGMATCLYCVQAATDPGQALEGLSIADFSTSVLVARAVEGISFGLGATMAFRREALDSIGGFEPVLDYLADDYQLGHRIASAGWTVRLAPVVLDAVLPPTSLSSFFYHQLRWMRTYRVSRPGGHLAFIVTQGLPWALALAWLHPAGAWALVGWTALRMVLVWRTWTLLGGQQVRSWLWLTPFKDALYLVLWVSSFVGRRVNWGGRQFLLRSDGTMVDHRK